MQIVFFFFFSSRRRHTRLQGDWSSDVCSSDLAGAIAAEPLADVELEAHAVRGPRQIGQGSFVTAVDTPRRYGTQRTGHARLRRVHQEGNLRRRGVDVTGGEAQRGRIR